MKNLLRISMKKACTTLLLAAMVFTVVGCTKEDVKEDVQKEEVTDEGLERGEGETTFTFEVQSEDADLVTYTIHTDEKTVGAALLAEELIAGDDSEYGLYVKTVNGVTVDFDKDGKYWAFYIDGEMAATGVDQTDLVDGATYKFAVEK